MIGTNDIAWQYDLANEPTRLGNLIARIISDAPKALVVVAQIGPSNDDARTALIKTYNDGIPAVVQARVAAGKHVSMVDMFTPFVSNGMRRTCPSLGTSFVGELSQKCPSRRWTLASRISQNSEPAVHRDPRRCEEIGPTTAGARSGTQIAASLSRRRTQCARCPRASQSFL